MTIAILALVAASITLIAILIPDEKPGPYDSSDYCMQRLVNVRLIADGRLLEYYHEVDGGFEANKEIMQDPSYATDPFNFIKTEWLLEPGQTPGDYLEDCRLEVLRAKENEGA
ncbi:hypothetical protein LCGC14_1301950 [marine sediment metagenome]|uniref:Uncharacterized protein n=1 Tax=marine sediment metagenome TaxID=412755 RepID=A0A0F9KQP4_9ZZZZ